GRSVRAEDLKTLATYPIEPKYYNCPVSRSIDKNDACAHLAAGEQKLVEGGHTGMDVEYYRVISRPGQPDVRQRFFWRYQMYPDKCLGGKAATPPPSTPPGSTTAPANPPPTSAPAPPSSAQSPKP